MSLGWVKLEIFYRLGEMSLGWVKLKIVYRLGEMSLGGVKLKIVYRLGGFGETRLDLELCLEGLVILVTCGGARRRSTGGQLLLLSFSSFDLPNPRSAHRYLTTV